MRIVDLLKKESILVGGTPQNKTDAICQMVALMEKNGEKEGERGKGWREGQGK